MLSNIIFFLRKIPSIFEFGVINRLIAFSNVGPLFDKQEICLESRVHEISNSSLKVLQAHKSLVFSKNLVDGIL